MEVAISAALPSNGTAQELGGKSALLILDDADLQAAVIRPSGVCACMANSTNLRAPTRMAGAARALMRRPSPSLPRLATRSPWAVPADPGHQDGPDLQPWAAMKRQQRMIGIGIEEVRARVAAAALAVRKRLERGFYARAHCFRQDVRRHGHRSRGNLRPKAMIDPHDAGR
ncbi:hypothetical protein ACU4GD_31050 [Cupriavidus basilensis]